MIRPTRRMIFAALALAPLALLPAILGDAFVTFWLAALSCLLLAFVVDALTAALPGQAQVDVQAPDEVYIGDRDEARVSIRPGRGRISALELAVELDEDLEPFASARPTADEQGVFAAVVPLVPLRRGLLRIEKLWWRWTGPLGLCERRRIDDLEVEIAVVPNLRAVREAALFFATRPEFLSGMKLDRRLGEGSEFDRMRDFVPGMDIRSIDWKASARHRRLMARQYRAERNHLVVMSLDTGRHMGEPLDGLPRLDHAVNAALLLGWSCLKSGDRVALHAFDERTHKYVEAEGGVAALPRIRRATADLDYGSSETNYTLGLTELSLELRRRALIVVITEFTDSITAEIMVDNLTRLARRHLVLFVTLRDSFLDQAVNIEPEDLEAVGRSVVTAEMVREREIVFRKLTMAGVRCLDVLPEQLSAKLVQSYLDIKNRELL